MEDVIDRAARLISDLTEYTTVVLPPKGKQPCIRTVQLVPVSDDAALVVIVTDSGVVRDNVVHVSNQIDADTLYAISRSLTQELRGRTLQEACELLPEMIGRMKENQDILQGLYGYLQERGNGTQASHVAVGGTSKMLRYPEYNDVEKARNFLSLMETRDKLADIISTNGGEMAFTVRIGPETGIPGMEDCSIVTATYSTRNGQQGTIGVIGPTRMQYSKVISILNMMGHQLTDMFSGEEQK